jgi:hypothetical protein
MVHYRKNTRIRFLIDTFLTVLTAGKKDAAEKILSIIEKRIGKKTANAHNLRWLFEQKFGH